MSDSLTMQVAKFMLGKGYLSIREITDQSTFTKTEVRRAVIGIQTSNIYDNDKMATNNIVKHRVNMIFLSCLCGSELTTRPDLTLVQFLSCLCGSEHEGVAVTGLGEFLSCLCGSELKVSGKKINYNSKLKEY